MKNLNKIILGCSLAVGFSSLFIACDVNENSSSNQEVTYKVNLPSNVTNGSVTASNLTVNEDGSVTFDVVAENHYQVESFKVNGQSYTLDQDGKVTIDNVKSDLNVEVNFIGVDVEVNFSCGEFNVEPISVNYNSTYHNLPTLDNLPDGYKFGGWYATDTYQGEAISNDSIVTNHETHTLYGLITPNTYEVTFNTDGGLLDVNSIDVTFNEKYGDLPIPNKENAIFLGWYNENDVLVTSDSVHSMAKDVTLKAKYGTLSLDVENQIKLVNLPGDDPGLTLNPQIISNGQDLTSNFEITLTSNNSGVIVDGLTIQASNGVDNETAIISVCVNGASVYELEVFAVDYEGQGYIGISSKDEFMSMNGNSKYILLNDITIDGYLASSSKTPLIDTLSSSAIIDGNGHKVINAKLCGEANNGWIKNVEGIVRNIYFDNLTSADSNPYGTGLFVELKNNGLLENIYVDAYVPVDGSFESVSYTGGVLVGKLSGGTIKDVILNIQGERGINFEAYGAFAGIVENNKAKVYNSYAFVNHTNLKPFGNEHRYGYWESAVQDESKVYDSVHTFLNSNNANKFTSPLWNITSNNISYNNETVLVAEASLSAFVYENFIYYEYEDGAKLDYEVYRYGEQISNYDVIFTSDNTSIVDINSNGVMTFGQAGLALIKIKVNGIVEIETLIEVKPEYTLISTVEDWVNLIPANPAGKFRLANDIDFNNGYLTGASDKVLVDTFSGILDGQGYVIKNGQIPGGWLHHYVFGDLSGTIENIAFINIYGPEITTNTAIVNDNKGTIQNVYVDYVIRTNGTDYGFAGTIAGYAGVGLLKNTIVNVRLDEGLEKAPEFYGSIVGKASNWHGTLENCYSIVHDTGVKDLCAEEAASGIIAQFKGQGSEQYQTYTQLRSMANLSNYDSSIWSFTDQGIEFAGKLVYEVQPDDAYEYISTAKEFVSKISANPSGKFRIANDIDFKNGYLTGSNTSYLTQRFMGEIQGQGYRILNAKLPSGLASNALFAMNLGTIKDIAFINLMGPTSNNNSGLVGQNVGTMDNLFVDYVIYGDNQSNECAGVLANDARSGVISNCIVNLTLATSVVTTPTYLGSLVGKVSLGSSITNSYAIVGDLAISNIAIMEVQAGAINNLTTAKQYEKYSDIYLNGEDFATYNSDIWKFTNSNISMRKNVILIDASVDPYIYISTAEEWYSAFNDNPSGMYKLANDIDLRGGWFTPTGSTRLCDGFKGELDGNGHTVSNAWLPGGWLCNSAFGNNYGTIKNIAFINIYASHVCTNTAIVSANFGTIENIYVDMVVRSDGNTYSDGTASSIAAYSETGVMKNCIANMRLDAVESPSVAPSFYGSIIGKANNWKGTVQNCHAIVNNTGIKDISAADGASGGVTAQFKGQGSAQHLTYADLLKDADLSSFNPELWTFNSNSIEFNGKVIYQA